MIDAIFCVAEVLVGCGYFYCLCRMFEIPKRLRALKRLKAQREALTREHYVRRGKR